MGALLSLFSGRSLPKDYIPDFDNATPASDADQRTYDIAAALISEGEECITKLNDYEVATAAVRRAIEDPNAESDCFAEVLPNIESLQFFWSYSTKLAETVETLLARIAAEDDNKNKSPPLEALAVKYAELLKVAIQWDYRKMMKSNLQNDLAFYRRCMDRQAAEHDLPVSQDATTHISMMLAQALPMLQACSVRCKNSARNNPAIAKAAGKLSEFCRLLIKKEKFPTGSPYYELCIYAMCGSFVLFDAINNGGGFKSKLVNPEKIVKCVNGWGDKDRALVNQMKSLIRYGAPNFEQKASKKLKNLID